MELAFAIGLVLSTLGCAEEKEVGESASEFGTEIDAVPQTGRPEDRQVYFGDLHMHSSWSLDAYGAGVRVGPEDAYRYALGESIPHIGGQDIQLAGPPLDFMALTDHAEYLGVIQATSAMHHPLHALPLVQSWFRGDGEVSRLAWRQIRDSFSRRQAIPELATNKVVMPAWRKLVDLANQYNRSGTFTAFVGYEYTSNPLSQNLHRNILFRRGNAPPRPFSSMDSENPEDLWNWMDRVRGMGADDLLAIPHNANGSNGLMFARTKSDGSAIDRAWAKRRARNEPLVEVIQIKGQSETAPILSPNDEWAAFELAPWRTLNPGLSSRPKGSYARDALKTGLLIREEVGVNPYEFGMIGSTDGHNASSPFEEANYTGKIGSGDSTPERRLAMDRPDGPNGEARPSVSTFWSAAGLAGIWSDANTRENLFDALRRREAFSTSGPRIKVRLFAGWHFSEKDLVNEISQAGYAKGVPMGGVLPPRSENSAAPAAIAPTFLVAALKDPNEAKLERLQIIKGWTDAGVAHEQVFDIACADGARPDPATQRCRSRAAEPDLSTCQPDPAGGSNTLQTWWRDPSFDPNQRAFYYVRVLQIPTCRWSTWDALRLKTNRNSHVPPSIQERAITSPIWFEPS